MTTQKSCKLPTSPSHSEEAYAVTDIMMKTLIVHDFSCKCVIQVYQTIISCPRLIYFLRALYAVLSLMYGCFVNFESVDGN